MLLQHSRETATDPHPPERRVLRLEAAGVAILLSIFAAALAYGAWRTGLTVDEPSHLISSYLYWQGRDRLPPRDMPPLIKIVGGWPTLFGDLPVPADLGQPGDTRHEWNEGARLIERLPPEQIGRVLFPPRLALTAFPLLTGFLLWRWSRELFGPRAAVCVLAMWVCSPTVLGHGSLFKNDHAAACTYLFFWYCGWRLWRGPYWVRLALFTLATTAVLLSKMSMLFLIGVAPAIVLASFFRHRQWWRAATALLLHAIVCYLLILAAYQFETLRVTSNDLNALSAEPALPRALLDAMRPFEWLSIPGAMWTGLLNLFRSNNTSAVYFMGHIFSGGHPLYFVIALGLKMPLVTLAFVVTGVVCLLWQLWMRRSEPDDVFWIVPGALYVALASASALQLGVRLVLPAWPFLLLLAGMSVQFALRRGNGVWAVALLLAALAAEGASWYPNGIAYYNPFAGGARGSLRYLADSNIDWGQSLPELARWMNANRIRRIYLSHFGFDKPERYIAPNRFERLTPPWNVAAAAGKKRLLPNRGYYAISATLLPGYFFQPEYRNWYSRFWNMKPIAAPGGAILVYRIE